MLSKTRLILYRESHQTNWHVTNVSCLSKIMCSRINPISCYNTFGNEVYTANMPVAIYETYETEILL